ncbi:MAG TPA: TlpA disulfide reductase family protein [Thermoanaerobaculia bacterium]
MKWLLPAAVVLVASTAIAAELQEVNTPAEISRALPPNARLRVVNIWATWCVPCVAEMSDLRAIDAAFHDRDVAFVGVSLDDMIPGEKEEILARVRKFLDAKAIRYLNLYYVGKLNDLASHFRFRGEIPITIVFDAKGREVLRHQGPIVRTKFTNELKELLRPKTVGK